jgi:hypothetical protein
VPIDGRLSNRTIKVFFESSSGDPSFQPIEGEIRIIRGSLWTNALRGSYRLRLRNRFDPPDTIVVTGVFDTR